MEIKLTQPNYIHYSTTICVSEVYCVHTQESGCFTVNAAPYERHLYICFSFSQFNMFFGKQTSLFFLKEKKIVFLMKKDQNLFTFVTFTASPVYKKILKLE